MLESPGALNGKTSWGKGKGGVGDTRVYIRSEHTLPCQPLFASLLQRRMLQVVGEEGGGLPLFTELPRREILGNWASDIGLSRKLGFRLIRFSETQKV